MTTGKKLTTTELLFNGAEQMGLQPAWLMQGSLFSISTPVGQRFMYEAKSTLNSQLGSNLVRNKLTARLILDHQGLPGIPYLNTKSLTEAEQFLGNHAKIVVKPLASSNSHDVHIVDTPEQLRAIDLPKYILEKYIIGKEIRYLVLNGAVIGVHESEYGESVSETRELKRISYPESEWDTELTELALKTAKIFQLHYAAIDYLIGPNGEVHILEVNSSSDMKWFHAPTSGPAVDVARLFLEEMLQNMRLEAPSTPVMLATSPIKAYN